MAASGASVRVPGTSPAWVIAERACGSVMFFRSGTATSDVPAATVTLIVLPRSASVFAGLSWVMTVLTGSVLAVSNDRSRRSPAWVGGHGRLVERLADEVRDLDLARGRRGRTAEQPEDEERHDRQDGQAEQARDPDPRPAATAFVVEGFVVDGRPAGPAGGEPAGAARLRHRDPRTHRRHTGCAPRPPATRPRPERPAAARGRRPSRHRPPRRRRACRSRRRRRWPPRSPRPMAPAAGEMPSAPSAATDRSARYVSSASAIAAAVGKRAPGSRAIARRTIASRAGGIPARTSDISGGWAESRAIAIGRGAVALERPPAGQHLVEDDAERVDVRGRAGLLAARLLRAEVVDRAEGRPGQRHLGLGDRPGDPEVGDLHPAVAREHDVAGLHVPMDDAARVGGRQGPGDLGGDPGGLARRERTGPPQDRRQVLAVDELHDDERPVLVLTEVVDGDDVGVVERPRPTGPPGGSASRSPDRGRTRRAGS